MAFLEEEESVFLAALAFLDEFEDSAAGGFKATASVEDVDVTSVREANEDASDSKRRQLNARKKQLRRAGVYANSNRARNARGREVAELRTQLEKLQIDLQVLQNEKQDRKGQKRRSEEMAVREETAQIVGVWKEIADRQQRRRLESESENVRLKRAVDRQTKVAEALRSLMQKRASQVTDECSCFMNRGCQKHQVVHVLDFRGDVSAFQGLFRRLDAAYREVDAVFSANGLSSMVITPNDVHIRESNGGTYLELFSNKVLPFGLQDATEALWEHFSGTEKHWGNGSLYEKATKDLDEPYTILEDFTKELYSNTSRADIKVKQVVRRYVEPDRDVVIWVSRVAPVAIRHEMLRGLTYNLQGYAVMKRSPVSTLERDVSQMQSCTLIFLDQEVEKIYGPDNLRTLTNFLIVNSAQNIRAHQARIENVLVDRMISRRMQ